MYTIMILFYIDEINKYNIFLSLVKEYLSSMRLWKVDNILIKTIYQPWDLKKGNSYTCWCWINHIHVNKIINSLNHVFIDYNI